MNKKRIALVTFCISIVTLLTSCGLLDSQIQQAVVQTQAAWTPVPTFTPYPTFTPLPIPPTSTPISNQKIGDEVVGTRWKVKVTKVETASEFGTWNFPAGSTNYFVIVTVDYTYLGSEKISFYPEGVTLVDVGTELTGWSRTPRLYRNENSEIIDFSVDSKVMILKSGDTHIDTFAYEFPNYYKEFILYFPETLPIEIQVK